MHKYFYLLNIQFLGFRYSGWQKQPNVKTVQLMVDKTINFVLKDYAFKTLAAGRTDAMVSANNFYLELFCDKPLTDLDEFKSQMIYNLPPDVRLSHIEEVDSSFRIMNDPKQKEYRYYFAFGEKFHPFCAPLLAHFKGDLDIHLMKNNASVFIGEHNFKNFCFEPNEHTQVIRSVDACSIEDNNDYTANFFPKNSYVFKVKGKGFLRHQVRLMVGALVELGQKKIRREHIIKALNGEVSEPVGLIAPSSGLILHSVEFE